MLEQCTVTSTTKICPDCLSSMIKKIDYIGPPRLLVLEYPSTNINTSHELELVIDDETTVLHFRGIVYHGENHCTSRIISPEGNTWYHDGMTTRNTSVADTHLNSSIYANLKTCQGKRLVLAIYV